MAAPQVHHANGDFRLLHAAAYLSLMCVGLYAATFGPALPFIADDLDISLDTAGLLLTALFIGSISASATIAIALHGRDVRAMSAWGLGAAAVGLLALGFAPNWQLALVGGVVLGVGDGLMVAALHMLISMTSRDVPSAVNRLNIFFSIGTVIGPIWAGALLATTEQRSIVYAGLAAAVVLSLIVMLAASAPIRQPLEAPDEEFVPHGGPVIWIMGAVLFLYVGAEFGLGTWVSTYAEESAGAGVFEAAVLTAGYWAALLVGRILSAAYFARGRDALRLLALSIAGAGVASIVLAASSGNIAIGAAAAFAAGLCFGPVWPATVAIASVNSRANTAAAIVTLGNAGGLVLPWAQGRVLVSAGPTQGVVVTSVLCGLMLAIVAVFWLRGWHPSSANA